MRKSPTVDHLARFFKKVNSRGVCWEWEGQLTPDNYGRFTARRTTAMAHRWIWEELVGPIPEGYQIDHLCQHTKCVNPDHLEPVTPEENYRRKKSCGPKIFKQRRTHCKNGHELAPDNLYWAKTGRRCKTCSQRSNRNTYLRHRERILADLREERRVAKQLTN